MDYRYVGKRKTLALGFLPAVSLAKARQGRGKARELLADGIAPGKARRDDKCETEQTGDGGGLGNRLH